MIRSRVVAGVVAGVLLAAGCTPADSGSLGRAPSARSNPVPAGPTPGSATASAPTATTEPTTEPTATAEPPTSGPTATGEPTGRPTATRTITVAVWFLRDGALAPTSRTRPVTPATARLAVTELIDGPSSDEVVAGMTSALPDDPWFDISISDQRATVDFAGSFYSGDADTVQRRQAQVVYTLTQFPTVADVQFRSNGVPHGEPVDRGSYEERLPPIVVSTPTIGIRVTSPVAVTGSANVFEATVSIRILDASGSEIGTSFTQATCGTGCRGDYAVKVGYQLASEQPGTVQVFSVSAADGSRTHVVDIPVTLAPNP